MIRAATEDARRSVVRRRWHKRSAGLPATLKSKTYPPSQVFKGKKIEKGIAFPTCISTNNCCGHYSPLKEDSSDLKDGDVCKMCVPSQRVLSQRVPSQLLDPAAGAVESQIIGNVAAQNGASCWMVGRRGAMQLETRSANADADTDGDHSVQLSETWREMKWLHVLNLGERC